MSAAPLADTRFFMHGLGVAVTDALSHWLTARGAQITEVSRLNDFNPPEDGENVLVVQYQTDSLEQVLPTIKRDFSSLRVLLLHEFIERGKIERAVLSATDHILEKPFTRAAIEKAITQFRFHPLAGKAVFVYSSADKSPEEDLLKILGATVIRKLPTGHGGPRLRVATDGEQRSENSNRLPLELAVFAPENLSGGFREILNQFRAQYADVPIFMLYDPQIPGTLDSEILAEVAYLIQKPIKRKALRQKMLDFFDQPQKDRRKNPRKKGISQMWISAFNLELGTPELFESPYLIDISQSGLSFQTYMQYGEGQLMAVWIISEDYPDKIIDLRGHIRWRRDGDVAHATAGAFKYGLEFTRQDSDAYINFARMIAMH